MQSVGQVAMDLVLNQRQFNKELNNVSKTVTNTFSKLKNIAIGAFSIVAIKNFSNACENAYKSQIESERKLFEVMSKRENATKESVKDILKLADAQQKLGVIGDEVQLAGAQELSTYIEKADSIKSLLPVMNNMLAQQYGYNATQEEAVNIATMMGKVLDGQTGALSRYGYYFDENQEKILKFGNEEQRVAVLTKIVQDSIGNVNQALGDTPIGRQIQLANAWGDVKEQIGYVIAQVKQALIPVFSVLVNILGRAVSYVRQFMQALGFTAKAQKKTSSAINYGVSNVDAYADALDNATSSSKKLKKAMGSVDELNVLSKGSSSGDSGASNSGIGDIGGVGGVNDIDFNMGIDGDVEVSEKVQKVVDFIQTSFKNLKKVVSDVWNSKPIQSFAGAVSSYGNYVYDYWTTLGGNLFNNLSITWSNIEGNLSGTLTNMSTLWTNFWTDIDNGIQTWGQPIIDSVSGVFNSIWTDAVDPAIQLISKVWKDFSGTLVKLWDKHGKPLVDNVGEFAKGIIDLFQSIWDNVLEPIVTPFLETMSWLWNEHLSKMIEKVGDFIGKLVNGVLEIWNKVVQPIIKILLEKLAPAWSSISSLVTGVLGSIFAVVSDVFGSIIGILGGVIDFIVGVFTGNWKKAWEGIKDIFKNIVDGLVGIFKFPINLIIDGINSFIAGLNKVKVPDWVPLVGGKGINIPKIPKLAQGAYFPRNNPQLAIVGDNTREGEITTPESKIYEQTDKAIKNNQDSGKIFEMHIYHHYEDGKTIIQKINRTQIEEGKVLLYT